MCMVYVLVCMCVHMHVHVYVGTMHVGIASFISSLSRGNEKEKTLKQACFQGYPESAVYVQIRIGFSNSVMREVDHTLLRPS